MDANVAAQLLRAAEEGVTASVSRRLAMMQAVYDTQVRGVLVDLDRFGEDHFSAVDHEQSRRAFRALVDRQAAACEALLLAANAVGDHEVLDPIRIAKVDLVEASFAR